MQIKKTILFERFYALFEEKEKLLSFFLPK